MSKRNVYDTLMWIKAIRNAGFTTFTYGQLVEHGLDNRSHLFTATNLGFLIPDNAYKSCHNVNLWTFDDNRILRSKLYKKIFGE